MRTQKISNFTKLSKHKIKLSENHSDSDIWTSAKGQYIKVNGMSSTPSTTHVTFLRKHPLGEEHWQLGQECGF